MGDPSQEAQSTGDVDVVPSVQLAPILRAILQHNDQIVEQNQAILQLLNYHVSSLPAKTSADVASSAQTSRRLSSQQTAAEPQQEVQRKSPNLPPSEHDDQTFAGDRPFQSMWTDVLAQHSNQVPSFTKGYHDWRRPSSVRGALLARNPWCSKEYQLAHPGLFDFLAVEESVKRCHSQVVVRDFYERGAAPTFSAYNELRPRQLLLDPALKTSASDRRRVCLSRRDDPLRAAQLWNHLEVCACRSGRKANASASGEDATCMRSIAINDMSPRALACVLASTPPMDLDRMGAFMQRHLAGSNWGNVLPARHGDRMSSFSLEYHFSFFFVTANRLPPERIKSDARGLRKSARFGARTTSHTKFIHEESMSFFLIGHFKDVSTCVQLAESYFKHDPYDPGNGEPCSSPLFIPVQQDTTPAELLLAWMTSALHHVSGRWWRALDAVQAEIQFSRQTVFMDDRNDLMTDDPDYSLSKTYFWALQAYRLFEDAISETVNAWRIFKEESLPRLRDERMATAAWFATVQGIDKEITSLDGHVVKIRRRIAEIEELRKALDTASAMFNSRTSVRQADSIRVLTVVTSICLPIIVVASIFGMQFMGTANGYIIAFGATMAAVIIATIFVVFNVRNALQLWNSATGRLTSRLRAGMQHHHRTVWHRKAVALQQTQAMSRSSSATTQPQTSAWLYLLFIIEFSCVTIFVRELAAAAAFFRSESDELDDGERDSRARSSGNKQPKRSALEVRLKTEQTAYEKRQREKRREDIGAFPLAIGELPRSTAKASGSALRGLLNVVRVCLTPFWAAIVLVEFLLFWFCLAVVHAFRTRPKERFRTVQRTSRQRAVDAMGLGVISRSEDEIEHLRKPPVIEYTPPPASESKPSIKHPEKPSEERLEPRKLSDKPSDKPSTNRSTASNEGVHPLRAHSIAQSIPQMNDRFSFEQKDSTRNTRGTFDEIESMSRRSGPPPSTNTQPSGPVRPSEPRTGPANKPGPIRVGSPNVGSNVRAVHSPTRPSVPGSPSYPVYRPSAPSSPAYPVYRPSSPSSPSFATYRSPGPPYPGHPPYRPSHDPRYRPPGRPPPAPPTRLPPSPPARQQRPPIPLTMPSSPTTASDNTSRPGTAQTHATDSFGPLPEIFTRSQPLRRLSADSITELYAGTARNSATSGDLNPGEGKERPTSLTLTGDVEQGKSTTATGAGQGKGRNTIRKSEYVDILNLGRAPKVPPKDEGPVEEEAAAGEVAK